MLDRTTLWLILLIISVVMVNLFALFEWHPSYVTNDGVQYLSTASNWLKGNGFSTNALTYSPHFQGDFPGPQTIWPPGYPIAISILGYLGIELTTSGLILNLLTHAFASVMVVLIMRRMKVNTNFAIFCAILFYAMATPWNFTRALLTEPLFTCLLFSAILFLPVPGRSRFTTWLLCGLFVGCGIYVRYSAAIFAASVGVGIFLFLLYQSRGNRKNLLSNCLRLAALILIPAFAFLHLMYRTNILTGTLDRNAGTRLPETVYSTIRQWGSYSSDLLGFSAGGIFTHKVGVILFFITLILVFSLVLYAAIAYRKDDDQDHQSEPASYSRIAGFVITAHGLLTFIYLTYCSLTDSSLQIVPRYLYQIYPGIYILFCVLMYGLIGRTKNQQTGKNSKLLSSVLGILVAIYVVTQVNEATSSQRLFAEGQAANKLITLPVADNVTLAGYIESCTSDQGSVWSTHGQHIHFHTEAPTITLAEIYTNTPPDFAKFQQQIETYDIKLFVFFNNDLNQNLEYKQHLDQIKQWLVKNGYNSLPLQSNVVNSHSTADVYRSVDQNCS